MSKLRVYGKKDDITTKAVIEIIKYHKSFLQPYEYVVLKSVAEARDAAEAKLAKVVDALNKAKAYITDLEEHEGAEGFSRSTAVFMGEYYDALTELEKTE